MLTRRAFVGGAVGLAAGAARAAPLPAEVTRQFGIAVANWDEDVLFLTESGVATRYVSVRRRLGPGWRVCSVSHDGTTAAVIAPYRGGRDEAVPLAALPLNDRQPPRPVATPATWVGGWSWGGAGVIGTREVIETCMPLVAHVRNFRIDLTRGTWSELPLPNNTQSGNGAPATRHTVLGATADGNWLLTRTWGLWGTDRPIHLVSADGSRCRPLALPERQIRDVRLAPDGLRLLAVRIEPRGEHPLTGVSRSEHVLEVWPTAGGRATELGRWVIPDGDGPDGWVDCCWRADGRRVACLAQHRGVENTRAGCTPRPTGELVTLDPAGGNRRVVRSWVGAPPFRLLGWA